MAEETPLISNIWTQRSLGLDLSKGLTSVTHDDVEYVCNHFYPFIQLVNVDAVFAEETSINFIPSTSGWTIHDYGDAISTAAPHEFKKQEEQPKENSSDAKPAEISSSEAGLIMPQIITISEIAGIIANKGWSAVELIAGTKMMQRLFWIESKRYGFELKGFTPNASDEKCYELLHKQAVDNDIVWEKHPTIEPKPKDTISGAS